MSIESISIAAIAMEADQADDLDYVRITFWDRSHEQPWLGAAVTSLIAIDPSTLPQEDEFTVWLGREKAMGNEELRQFGRAAVSYRDYQGDPAVEFRHPTDDHEYF